METVINKLSEIEAAAHQIMEGANNRKVELTKDMDLKMQKFDATVKEDTAKKLENIRKRLESDMEKELAQLKQNTQDTLDAIDKKYAAEHDAIATEIFEKLIRM